MTTAAVREFALEIDREFEAKMRGAKRAVIFIALEADHKVVTRSPVDVGTFKNSWLTTVGQTSDETPSAFGEFATRSAGAIASYVAVQGFPQIFVQNNQKYALALEHGHSQQAPNGVLAISVAELQALWNRMPPL